MQQIQDMLSRLTQHDPVGRVSRDDALREDLVGLRLFDPPLVRVASASDPLFERLREPQAVGPLMRLPSDWLPEARCVVSYFFPMSQRVRESNRTGAYASDEWFHARIQGQAFIVSAGKRLCEHLRSWGFQAICPAAEPDFEAHFLEEGDPDGSFRSNWSERHVAYVCGLGTFSLSKGVITERGTAGRFGSIVTDADLPVTPRPYEDLYEYCSGCGSCIARCPEGAISIETGKDNLSCYGAMVESRSIHPGYVGCGKCQVGVPCETGIPTRRAQAV